MNKSLIAFVLASLLSAMGLTQQVEADQQVQALHVAVIKANLGVCPNGATCLCPKGATCHLDRAGVWIPQTNVAIVSVSVAEQSDVALYVDLEISTKPVMYMCNEQDATGCIFRMKYVGPGLFDYGASSGNTYLGSNITNTNITFPTGYGIAVNAGVPVYVHLDVRNESLIDIQVDQDAWIYYVPLP
jgi:hypothetical protein